MDAIGGLGLAMLGAALAVGLPGAGSSIGIGYVGSAAAGLVSDEPEKFGKVLLLELLPGTQGIYGFIAFAFILLNIGVFEGAPKDISTAQGFQFLFAALPIAIAGYGSALGQGRVAAAGIGVLAKKPEQMSKAMLLAVMVETYAVFALLATILLINGIQV